MERCHNENGVHIPGCMGCAAMGHEHCTCDPAPRIAKDDLERRLERLENILVNGIPLKDIAKMTSPTQWTGKAHP